jgi:hypothetical protein
MTTNFLIGDFLLGLPWIILLVLDGSEGHDENSSTSTKRKNA